VLVDPALVVPLSLLGALGLACVGLLIRLGLRHGSVDESVIYGFISSCAVLLTLVLITSWPPGGTPLGLGLYAADGVVSAVAVTLQYTAVGLVGPSIAYAVKSTSPLTAVLIAALFLGEIERWQTYLGVLLAAVGVGLLSVDRMEGALRFDRRVLIPLLGAVSFGAAANIRRFAAPGVSSPLVGLTISITCSLLAAVAWLLIRRRSLRLNAGTPYFLWGGVGQAAALLCVYTALRSGHVAVVAPLYTSSPLFVLLLSPLVLGKLDQRGPRVVAGALIVLGAVGLITAYQ
jgi:drug/metabolite transporter (DMT)-like permease